MMDDEEELNSLMRETGGAEKRRNRSIVDTDKITKEVDTGAVQSKVPSLRLVMMVLLSIAVCIFLLQEQGLFEAIESNAGTSESAPKIVDSDTGYHVPTFGGVNNIAHPAGAKAVAAGEGIVFEDIVVPVSNHPNAIKSLNKENIANLFGHYIHDEHRSPYASHLYDKPKEFLDNEQEKFVKKMDAVRKEWGAWDLKDEKSTRPAPDFTSVMYKDLNNDQFPSGSWQRDKEYIPKFITEARALLNRMTEGIYAEYGTPLKKADGTTLSDAEKKERDDKWIVHVTGPEDPVPTTGIAYISQVAFDGLVRKLLHAMITNDEFYVVLGGHSAAAGHGNDFHQNKVISFHNIMEPVFDKLGMRLISRNMAMGGVGTLHFSLGGGDLYGEADFMEWDSSMTEKGPAVDLFNKQAILTGERVPVIFSPSSFHYNVMAETNGTAWMGGFIVDNSMIPETVDEVQALTIPYAARWMNEKLEKYNSICWEPRSDYTPNTEQAGHPSGQASWHPGFRVHQWQGRKYALVLMKGLLAALDKWEQSLEVDEPLPVESDWHVGDSYKTIREHLTTHITTPSTEEDDVRSHCETLIPWIRRICRVRMHGFGMWKPRAHVDYDFMKIIHPALNGYKPTYLQKQVYDGFNVLPLNQAIPDGEIDVHAIAIATTNPPPDLDHSWQEEEEEEEEKEEENNTGNRRSRRWLRKASEMGFRRGFDLEDTTASLDHKDMIEAQHGQSEAQKDIVLDNGLRKRKLDESSIIPGRGWMAHGWIKTDGFCDGSAMATCGRDTSDNCLMYATNDQHMDITGNSLSGWLVFTVPKVKEGIIMARMEWWCNVPMKLTADWTEIDDGKTMDTTTYNAAEDNPGRRRLKITIEQLVPDDFEMDIAINGVITKTMQREEWVSHTHEFIKNCAVWPLLDDETMAEKDWKEGEEGEPVEVGIRFRSQKMPQQNYCISHVYYA